MLELAFENLQPQPLGNGLNLSDVELIVSDDEDEEEEQQQGIAMREIDVREIAGNEVNTDVDVDMSEVFAVNAARD